MPYIPHNDLDRQMMLSVIGVKSIDDLFAHIPKEFRIGDLDLPDSMPEMLLQKHLENLAKANVTCDHNICFMGAGAYDHWIPPAVKDIAGKSEFVTAYTPYQPEISQGMLQAIFEYQTSIAALCGMEVSNASMYEGATAALETVAMACRETRRDRVVLDRSVHPSYRATIKTGAAAMGFDIVEVGKFSSQKLPGDAPFNELIRAVDDATACILTSNPTFFGKMRDVKPLADACHAKKVLLAVSVNPIPLAIVKSPGEMGVDIACGEGQPLGMPLQFGGPYLGFISTSKKLVRRMPGRIVGETVDRDGKRAFTLTLQTREQHIRREKATSNICSNQALCALTAQAYMSCVGKTGLRKMAELCLSRADYLKKKLSAIPGVSVADGPHFHEFVYATSRPAVEVLGQLLDHDILGGVAVKDTFPDYSELSGREILVAVTEKRSVEEIDKYAEMMNQILA